MNRRALLTALLVGMLLVLTTPVTATAAPGGGPLRLPFVPECKDAPVPAVPGHGLAAFFTATPETPPAEEDPFEPGAQTTMFEQYGLAGLRFNNYDLGCGPDAARDPGAVIGTSISNWLLQLPVALTGLTASLTQVAFNPSFLDAFDPMLTDVSHALHQSLFTAWIPAVLALLGIAVILRSRRAALATTAAAIGWSLMVVLLATALFRWPVEAGHVADDTVTSTLGTAVAQMGDKGTTSDPGTIVASQVEESILYRAWLAGTLGSATSSTAKKYGPELFKAQTLTWREASILEKNPDAAFEIVKAKSEKWKALAGQIEDKDPEAYEYLTGRRSEARVGYALMATIATFLALPFLLLSALLLLGSYMIVRLAVMLFPAFAVLGAFPAARGLVIGLGRVVGAALINAVVFGVGAGVTVMVLGLLFAPGRGTPPWLGLVLMPLFTYVMWKALRPFRRLTEMVSPHRDHFHDMAGIGQEARTTRRFLRRTAATAVGVKIGNRGSDSDENADESSSQNQAPHRAEADSSSPVPGTGSAAPRQLPAAPAPATGPTATPPSSAPSSPGPEPNVGGPDPVSSESTADVGYRPRPSAEEAPPEPVEPEWVDGEEVYTIYRPADPADDGQVA